MCVGREREREGAGAQPKKQRDAPTCPPSHPAHAVHLVPSPDGTRLALLPPSGGALLFDGDGDGPTLIDARGQVLSVAAFSHTGVFAAASEDGAVFVVTRCVFEWERGYAWSGLGRFLLWLTPHPPPHSPSSPAKRLPPSLSWPTPPRALAFGPGDALLAVTPAGALVGALPPYAAPPVVIVSPSDAGGPLACLAPHPSTPATLFAAGPGAVAAGGVRASVWRLGGDLTAALVAARGGAPPRGWLPWGGAPPAGWRAAVAPAGGLAAVAPAGEGQLALYVLSEASLSPLALAGATPPPAASAAAAAAFWGDAVVAAASPAGALAALRPPRAVDCLAPPQLPTCASLAGLAPAGSGADRGPRLAAVHPRPTGWTAVTIEALPPAAAVAAATAAGDWATAAAVAASHRLDADGVHLSRWRAGAATRARADECLRLLADRRAAVVAVLQAEPACLTDARDLVAWALEEAALHWPGGDDSDDDENATSPPSSPWPAARLSSALWWATARRVALRHAERAATAAALADGDGPPAAASFASLRDAPLPAVAASLAAAGAVAGLDILLSLHPRALIVVDGGAPALAALAALPETVAPADVARLLTRVAKPTAPPTPTSSDPVEAAAVTTALRSAGAADIDVLPTETARALAAPFAPPPTASVSAWITARAHAVDASTGQLGAVIDLLDACTPLAGGAADMAALASAARDLRSVAAAAAAPPTVSAAGSGSDDGAPGSLLPDADIWATPLVEFAALPPAGRARLLVARAPTSATARARAAALLAPLPADEAASARAGPADGRPLALVPGPDRRGSC